MNHPMTDSSKTAKELMYPCPAPEGWRWTWCISGEYAWFELHVREDEDDEMFAVGASRMLVPVSAAREAIGGGE